MYHFSVQYFFTYMNKGIAGYVTKSMTNIIQPSQGLEHQRM